jgi:ubiquinone biosynthesis protein COQ4
MSLELRRATTALRALFADPDDLPQVFTVIESLSGDTLARLERRLGKSEGGRRLLANRPDIVPILEDREALRRLPEGSLGRAYLAFVESENISAAGIVSADQKGHAGRRVLPPAQEYLRLRLRDTHDLWHAVTGYKGDVLGEAALLGFTLAQQWNLGIALIVGLGLVKTNGKPLARRLIADGYRRGRAAETLVAVEWEKLLAEPVASVRARLGVGDVPVYTPVRSSELKAQQRAAA